MMLDSQKRTAGEMQTEHLSKHQLETGSTPSSSLNPGAIPPDKCCPKLISFAESSVSSWTASQQPGYSVTGHRHSVVTSLELHCTADMPGEAFRGVSNLNLGPG